MLACPPEETILAFVEDRLRPEQRSATEAHIAGCDSCGALLAAVAASWFAEGRLPGAEEPRPSRLSPGARVGPYAVVAHAGSGGMGEVYRARDARLGREVALKVLPARFAREPERLARFRQEARAAGALSHPQLLTLYDVGVHEGIPYLVMEWLEGATLRERLAHGPLPAAGALRLGAQLARGLAAAHDKGIIHRDIKPANLFLCADGSCRILDFGLAKLSEDLEDGSTTRTGAVVGTVGYMAPEQLRGHGVDHRADLFALGAVIYEAVSGQPPFGSGSPVERISATLRDEPPRQEGELGALLARCLAKSPGERFQSAHDLAFSLESLAARTGVGNSEAPSRPAADSSGPRRSRGARGLFALAALMVVAAAALRVTRGRVQAGVESAHRPSYRPITFRRGRVLTARFSADGHTVVYGAAWDGARAELYSTRSERPLSHPLGVAADVLAVSPAGELALLLEPRDFDADHGSGTLAQMPLAGGAPRPVLEGVLEADWGGAGLAVVRRVAGRFRLEYPAGTVRYQSEGWISHPRVAPGGNRIAFLLHPNAKDDRGSVMVLDAEGPPRELSGGWASARGLAWAPGGREVWFTASKTDTDLALFAVDLDGALRLVDRMAGRMVLQDISADGTVLIDDQEVRTGLVVGGAGQERDLTWSDSSFLTDLSRDGRRFLFAEGGHAEGASYGAYLRGADGAPPVRLGDGAPMALSPDGKWVLTQRYGARTEFLLQPTGAGDPHPVSLSPIEVLWGARWFPDGKRLLLRGSEAGRAARLWVFEPGAGAPRPITAEGVAFETALAPDGMRIAAVDEAGTLQLLSAEGKPLASVPGHFEGQWVVGWDGSGDSVYLRSVSLPVHLSRVDVRTGAVTPHLSVPARADRPGLVSVMTLSLSADGSTYAYSDYETLSRLYLVEGLARGR